MKNKVTPNELMARWKKGNIKTIYRLIKRYAHILKPVKIGRSLLIDIENIEQFEQEMRVKNED